MQARGAMKPSGRILAGTAVSGLLALAGAPAVAETLTVSNGLAPTHVVSTTGFDPWMACVSEGTGGEIDFSYFPSGQLAPVKDSVSALNSGLAQVAWISPSNESNKLPLSGITLLPGLGKTSVKLTADFHQVFDTAGPVLDELDANNIKPLIIVALPAYQIMSATTPIKSLEDFSGRKVRVAGGAMNATVGALGGVPVEMPAGDLYVAMQRNTVDSTIFAYSSVPTYSLQELLKSISSNGNFGSGGGFIAISKEVFDAMPPETQAIVTDCGLQAEAALAEKLDAENVALQTEYANQGIEIYEIPADAMAAIDEKLAAVSDDYVKRLDDRGLPGAQAYEQFLAASKD